MDNPYQSPSSHLGGSESYTATGEVSPRALNIMARTKTWVLIVGILFCAMGVLTVINALTQEIPDSPMMNSARASGARLGMFFGAAISFLLYLIPGLKLVQYSKHIGRLLQSRRSQDLELALNQHRGFWKFVGILTIILLVIFVVAMFVAIAAASSLRAR